jgi:hypothetical protein
MSMNDASIGDASNSLSGDMSMNDASIGDASNSLSGDMSMNNASIGDVSIGEMLISNSSFSSIVEFFCPILYKHVYLNLAKIEKINFFIMIND